MLDIDKLYLTETTETIKNVVMLYSGGADSALMIRLSIMSGRRPYCILIDYGQKHIEELDYAKTQLEDLGVKYQIVKISGLNIDSGLTGSATQGLYRGVSVYNVPARNSIMLTIAAGIAESKNIDEVWIGCDMSDFYGQFPDCKQEYIGEMNKVFKIAFSYPIEIIAPLLGMTKEIILQTLEHMWGIKSDKIYTGYREFS